MMVLRPVMFNRDVRQLFPRGLVLYWLVNNLLTVGQQSWTKPRHPRPRTGVCVRVRYAVRRRAEGRNDR